MFGNSFFGRLTLQALEHDPVQTGGALSMVIVALVVMFIVTYYRRWTWLWKEWITTLDPKRIGVMYLIVTLVMFLRGLSDAAMMRAQQATSVGDSYGFLSADHFQQVFSAHGTVMIFFVGMGVVFGLMNLVVPLQIGARDVAFPFLNSLGFWLFFAGSCLVNLSLILGDFSPAGWLGYPPLSGIEYTPGVGVDYWIWALQIAGVGSLISGINFLVTIFRMRAPGMTMMKVPIFIWSALGCMVLVIFAFPILTATLSMLALDRVLGMHFFTAGFGGNPMLYVNLIWAWGHPEVYILILPAFGVFSEVVSTFSRKSIFGYVSMVWAIIGITFLSFIVWVHHFFTMGAGGNINAFFGIMTMIIAVPTGVKVFNWLFTMFRGRIHFTTPMLWFLGFLIMFTIGGMTGVLLSIPAIDFQVHNSLFLIAHFHNVIIGGVLFGLFAAITYWFPKIIGFRLHETLGKWAFWFWLVGFSLAFMPLYMLGFMGATRRLDHYEASTGWHSLFVAAAIGLMLIVCGVTLQIIQLIVSVRQRRVHRDVTGDPWNGRTLEWSTPSPPPHYNFAHIPEVTSRDVFWEMKRNGEARTSLPYEDIYMPKNSPMGLFIAAWGFVFCFGIVWHILWLVLVGILGVIACTIIRLCTDDTEHCVSAAEIEKIEKEGRYG